MGNPTLNVGGTMHGLGSSPEKRGESEQTSSIQSSLLPDCGAEERVPHAPAAVPFLP